MTLPDCDVRAGPGHSGRTDLDLFALEVWPGEYNGGASLAPHLEDDLSFPDGPGTVSASLERVVLMAVYWDPGTAGLVRYACGVANGVHMPDHGVPR